VTTALRNPPRPMEMAPAQSSARPAVTTNREEPIEDRPAVRAKGTVSPSERPIMLARSAQVILFDIHVPNDGGVDQVPLVFDLLPTTTLRVGRIVKAALTCRVG
jgi:hypothetical protein